MTQYIISGVMGVATIIFLRIVAFYLDEIERINRLNILPTKKTDQKLYSLHSKLIGSLVMAALCSLICIGLAISGGLYEVHDKNFVKDFTEYTVYVNILRQNELTTDEKTTINKQISKKNEVLSAARLSYLKNNDNGWRAYPKEVLEIKPIPKI